MFIQIQVSKLQLHTFAPIAPRYGPWLKMLMRNRGIVAFIIKPEIDRWRTNRLGAVLSELNLEMQNTL